MTNAPRLSPEWQGYCDALGRCCQATKLAAFHAREAARQVNITAGHALLASYHVDQYLEGKIRQELPVEL